MHSPFIQPPAKRRKPTGLVLVCIVSILATLASPTAWAAIKGTKVKRVSGWTKVHDGRSDANLEVSVLDVNDEMRCVVTADNSAKESESISCLSIVELEEAAQRKADREKALESAETKPSEVPTETEKPTQVATTQPSFIAPKPERREPTVKRWPGSFNAIR